MNKHMPQKIKLTERNVTIFITILQGMRTGLVAANFGMTRCGVLLIIRGIATRIGCTRYRKLYSGTLLTDIRANPLLWMAFLEDYLDITNGGNYER